MLDILRPSTGKAKPVPPRPASPTLSPASSTSTLRASSAPRHSQSASERARSTNRTAALSKGQQARRQSIESAVSSSYRHKYTLPDPQDNLLDPAHASSSSSRSSPGLAPFRRSTLSPPRAIHHSRGRSTVTATATNATIDPFRDDTSRTRKRSRAQKPLLGGLYFSDLIVVAFFYAVNLLRTCGIAELVDVAFKAFTYVLTRLPFDFYQRWALSRPATSHFASFGPLSASSAKQYTDSRKPRSRLEHPSLHRDSTPSGETRLSRPAPTSRTSSTAVSTIDTSTDDETSSQDAIEEDAQLSPFHHLIILLVRFACTSFPHLLPRVLFAEETIGPLVRWRTGGGAAGIVREFTSENVTTDSPTRAIGSRTDRSTKADPLRSAAGTAASSDKFQQKQQQQQKSSQSHTRPAFRAFWIGADAHVPVEVRRSDPSSKSASTLLYLHGGGFSLGSVAFYAEALIRIITKVCSFEDRDNDARCVAVEYDLSPTSRFPGPLLQCLRCYAHLIEVEGIDPASITIAGDSAGGNLTMAILLCLDGQARSEPSLAERDWSALPMPGKAVLISPWVDLRPSASLAFAGLRHAASKGQSASAGSYRKASGGPDGSQNLTDTRVSVWTEAIGQHEWDYVAAEALMHFAQLYAGVLKTPRRVRGPMGWVAHMCAVLAGDDDQVPGLSNPEPAAEQKLAASRTGSMSATAPLAILRSLILPSQKVARAAHSILTEPLLNRASSATSSLASTLKPKSDAFNEVEHIRPSRAGALEPIFPISERKTDAVPSTSDLFIPVWENVSDAQPQQEEQEESTKRGQNDAELEAAKELLDTSKLINPATGDWSRIRLKRGMLVVWGDRERMADDVESWVDRVRQSQSSRSNHRYSEGSDDQPSQDLDPSHSAAVIQGRSLQERRAASRSPNRLSQDLPEHAADWLCTAVEHGPGGVHAWPFVSMYLAGSEAEREKGLEIIARFIADPTPSPASTLPPTPSTAVAPLAVEMPAPRDDRYLAAAAAASAGYSPPHLNAVSPAGSMPSDISSRGEDQDYPFLGSSYTDSEGWDDEGERNELGLHGAYPHETAWTQPTPTPSTGAGTPMSGSDMDEVGSVGHDELVHRVGLGLGAGSAAESRSTAPTMEPVHLHRPAQPQSAVGAAWERDQFDTPRAAPRRSDSTRPTPQPQTLGGPSVGRSLADLEAESDLSAPPSRPDSPGSGWNGYSSYSEEDDLTAPSPQELDRDAYFGPPLSYADDVIPMDPGFYGLAHYHTLRPEGLSDIAEEESQFDTSSVFSSRGGESGALSPNFSPGGGSSPNVRPTRGGAGANPGRYGAAYTPSPSEMARLREALEERERQYQERFARRSRETGGSVRERFPIEEDDLSIERESDADVDVFEMPAGTPRADESGAAAGPASSTDRLQRAPSPARSVSSQRSGDLEVWW